MTYLDEPLPSGKAEDEPPSAHRPNFRIAQFCPLPLSTFY